MKNLLGSLLKQIAQLVNADDSDPLISFGVTAGKAGQILFNCHYAAYLQDETYYDLASNQFEEVLSRLNPTNYKSDFGSTYYQDLVEFGQLIMYLNANNHLAWNDNALLSSIDSILLDRMRFYIQANNLERVNGAISIGNYFLYRIGNSELAALAINILIEAIDLSKQINEKGHYYWICYAIDEPRVYTGTSHGCAMIVSFLANCCKKNIRIDDCLALIDKAAMFLINTRIDYKKYISSFPLWVGNEEPVNNMCIVYGDLSTSCALIQASILLKNDLVFEEALEIALLTLRRKTRDSTFLNDASILYGISGVYLLYDKLYQLTQNSLFLNAASFWLDKIPDFAEHETKYLNFKPRFYNEYHAANNGFGFGLIGIGLVIIQALSKRQYSINEFVWLA